MKNKFTYDVSKAIDRDYTDDGSSEVEWCQCAKRVGSTKILLHQDLDSGKMSPMQMRCCCVAVLSSRQSDKMCFELSACRTLFPRRSGHPSDTRERNAVVTRPFGFMSTETSHICNGLRVNERMHEVSKIK